MNLIGFEIVAALASPAVLFSVAAVALLFLSGLAAKVLLYFEDICDRRATSPPHSRPTSALYGTDVAVERGIVQ